MSRGRLWGMRAYLCGPMDHAKDGGTGWREDVSKWLESRGCASFNPTDKPIDLGGETEEDRNRRKRLLDNGEYENLAAEIKILRCVDLRMVDITDFVIVYLDRDAYPCGTYEELFLANREMKPILVMSPGGPQNTSLWIYGTIPHQHVFYTWGALFGYLDRVDRDRDDDFNRLKRWYFFDQERINKAIVGTRVQDAVTEVFAHHRHLHVDNSAYIRLEDLADAIGLPSGALSCHCYKVDYEDLPPADEGLLETCRSSGD